jgi:pimeloyl-ACP methyl ester carboxylesterase
MTDMILIPALGCNQLLYADVLPELSKVVQPSVQIPTADRYDDMVADSLRHSPEQFVVLGTSMGARLALEVTLAAPHRVQGTVIIGSGPGAVADQAGGLQRSKRMRDGEFETVLNEMGQMISHLAGPRGADTMALFKQMGQQVGAETTARQSNALAYRVDRWPRLPEITTPVLCLWGQYDQFSPCTDGKQLAQTVLNGTYVELPDCGHFPTLEYPDETAAAITTWLADQCLI